MGLGAVPRGLKETQLGRQYDYQQSLREDPMQALKFIQGFAPQYRGGQTQVTSAYGAPVDPLNAGLSAGLGTFRSFQNQGQAPQSTDVSSLQQQIANLQSQLQQQQGGTPPASAGGNLNVPGGGGISYNAGYAPPGTNSAYYNQFGTLGP